MAVVTVVAVLAVITIVMSVVAFVVAVANQNDVMAVVPEVAEPAVMIAISVAVMAVEVVRGGGTGRTEGDHGSSHDNSNTSHCNFSYRGVTGARAGTPVDTEHT